VSDLSRGSISAQVGVDGSVVTVLIESAALPPTLGYLFKDPFGFSVHAGHADVQDEAPGGAQWPMYG
jgi:hypothetical protein